MLVQSTTFVPKGIEIVQVTLNDMSLCGRGYMNFYSCRTNKAHKSMHLLNQCIYIGEDIKQVGCSRVEKSIGFRLFLCGTAD
jgi:hypothetical protein